MDPKLSIRAAAILANITIFQVLDTYRIPYAGKITQQIRCPVHKDRTPSARVYADNNKVYCFTCAKLWDVIELVRSRENTDFVGALGWLETQFLVPPASANLTQVLKGQIRRRQEVKPDELYELVEARIMARRDLLGLVKYTKALYALDMLMAQAKSRVVSMEKFEDSARAILKFTNQT